MSTVALRTSWALGRNEARRLVVHPAYLAGALLVVPTVGVGAVADASLPSARQVFDFVVNVQLVWYGLMSLLAAGMVASLARRSGAEEVLESQPAGSGTRAAARCLAVLLGPGTLSAVLTTGLGFLAVYLSDARRRGRVLALGAVLVAATLVAGWAQLP